MSSEIKVNKITTSSGSTLEFGGAGDTVSIGSGATATGFGGGKVLQVIQAVKTDTFSTVGASLTDITGLNASITPSSSSSKILIQASIGTHDTSSASNVLYRLMRDSTPIGVGDTSTQITFGGTVNPDRGEGQGMMYLDSPSSTSPIVYKLQAAAGGSNTLYINFRNGSSYYAISTITLMEIAG